MDDRKRKSIFVTEAAGGIGSAVVQKFARKGWIVGAYDLTELTFSGELADHPNVITGVLDVTDPDNWDRALAEFAEHTGGLIDVLDNNAGVVISDPAECAKA